MDSMPDWGIILSQTLEVGENMADLFKSKGKKPSESEAQGESWGVGIWQLRPDM